MMATHLTYLDWACVAVALALVSVFVSPLMWIRVVGRLNRFLRWLQQRKRNRD